MLGVLVDRHDQRDNVAHESSCTNAPDRAPQRPEKGQIPSRRLVTTVLASAIVAGLVTYMLVRDAGPPQHPPSATGGLLVLTNGPLASVDADAVEISTEISRTGYPGDARMLVTLTFAHPRPGLRWTLVASGQYEVSQKAPTDAFCRVRATQFGRHDVACPADVFDAPPVHIYRRRELAAASPDGLSKLIDHTGYDPRASSMVTGELPSDPAVPGPAVVKVAWPIRAISSATAGSATYGALAPVAASDFEYGSFVKLSRRDLTRIASFADGVDFSPLNLAKITSVTCVLRTDLGYRSITQASPVTVSSDRLTWNDPAIRTQGMRYVLHDPVAEGTLLRKTFIGGVMGGLAASLLVWAIQLGLERRRAGAGRD